MYRSLHPPLDIPATPLAEFVLARAAARGQRPALVSCGNGAQRFIRGAAGLVDRTAVGLAALGIAKGDVCAIFAVNSPEYVIAVLAIVRLGCRRDDGEPRVYEGRSREAAADSGARVLFTSQALAPIWTQTIAGTAVERVVMFDDPGAGAAQVGVSSAADSRRSPRRPALFRAVTIEPDDLVALPYSSGTTGLPKA